MYLKSRVKLPDVHGKLTRLRRGDITYIKYEYDRYYDPEKKYTYPQRATIGKVIIPGLFEPPVRTLRATIPENESHIFR